MAREALRSATFRCEDRAATVRYCGSRQWQLSGPDASWSGPHEEVAAALREALRLAGEVPYNSKVVEVSAERVTGTLKNNTFPTELWFVDLNGDRPWAGAESGLDAAIMAALVALELAPVRAPSAPAMAFDRGRFDRPALEAAADRQAWARDLGHALAARLRAAMDAQLEVSNIVAELKALGHDLWSFDESDDFAIWTYDYVNAPPGPQLGIHFRYAAYEEPAVEVTVRDAS
jgi:hypothetical protein